MVEHKARIEIDDPDHPDTPRVPHRLYGEEEWRRIERGRRVGKVVRFLAQWLALVGLGFLALYLAAAIGDGRVP